MAKSLRIVLVSVVASVFVMCVVLVMYSNHQADNRTRARTRASQIEECVDSGRNC